MPAYAGESVGEGGEMLATIWTNERRRTLIRTVHKQVQERAALKQDLQAIGRALAQEPAPARETEPVKKQKQKQTRKRVSPEDVAIWHRLKAEGKTSTQIAKAAGVAVTTVTNNLAKYPPPADLVTARASSGAGPVTSNQKEAIPGEGGALVLAGDADESPAAPSTDSGQAWVNGLTRRINAFRDEMEAIGVPVDVKVSLHLTKEIRLE